MKANPLRARRSKKDQKENPSAVPSDDDAVEIVESEPKVGAYASQVKGGLFLFI